MICPRCGFSNASENRFCACCGRPVEIQDASGSHRVPIALLCIMSIAGIAVYYLTQCL